MGYTKLSLSSGYSIAAIQFQGVGGGQLGIDKVTSGDFVTQDQIRFWDGTGYTTLAYYGEDADGGVYDSDGETCLGPGWGDSDQIAADYSASAGNACWIESANQVEVTVSGEVTDNTTVSFSAGYNLIANPRPESVALTAVTSDSLATQDQIRFWDGNGYTTYAYYGEDADGGVYASDGETCLGPGWGDSDQLAVTRTIAVGEGFWLETAGSGTLSFSAE